MWTEPERSCGLGPQKFETSVADTASHLVFAFFQTRVSCFQVRRVALVALSGQKVSDRLQGSSKREAGVTTRPLPDFAKGAPEGCRSPPYPPSSLPPLFPSSIKSMPATTLFHRPAIATKNRGSRSAS